MSASRTYFFVLGAALLRRLPDFLSSFMLGLFSGYFGACRCCCCRVPPSLLFCAFVMSFSRTLNAAYIGHVWVAVGQVRGDGPYLSRRMVAPPGGRATRDSERRGLVRHPGASRVSWRTLDEFDAVRHHERIMLLLQTRGGS